MRAVLRQAIIAVLESGSEHGVPMGELIDTLEHNGFAVLEAELELWEMLRERRITPSGFVCRTSRGVRAYEFLLTPWSPHLDGTLDQQLELQLSP